MATAVTIEPTVEAVQAELLALEDPGLRAANEKRGDDHGVNLTRLGPWPRP